MRTVCRRDLRNDQRYELNVPPTAFYICPDPADEGGGRAEVRKHGARFQTAEASARSYYYYYYYYELPAPQLWQEQLCVVKYDV